MASKRIIGREASTCPVPPLPRFWEPGISMMGRKL